MFSQHSGAAEVRRWVVEETWSSYFKFAVERNPWDRVVSYYWWRNYVREQEGDQPFETITEFIERMRRRKPFRLSNWHIYAQNHHVSVDKVIPYENMVSELETLKAEGILPASFELPRRRLKGNQRPKGQSYREVLSSCDRRVISELCWREIEYMGYEF